MIDLSNSVNQSINQSINDEHLPSFLVASMTRLMSLSWAYAWAVSLSMRSSSVSCSSRRRKSAKSDAVDDDHDGHDEALTVTGGERRAGKRARAQTVGRAEKALHFRAEGEFPMAAFWRLVLSPGK